MLFRSPLDTKRRLLRAGFVIETGMDHPTVSSSLVGPDLCLFFEHDNGGSSTNLEHRRGSCQANDAAAYDDHIHGVHYPDTNTITLDLHLGVLGLWSPDVSHRACRLSETEKVGHRL